MSSLLGSLTVGILGNASGLNDSFRDAQSQVQRFGQDMERVGRNLTTIGTSLTAAITLPIVALATAAVKSSIKFESAFAGVIKTVDATEKELAGLRQGIIDMSKEIPSTAAEIASVAEAAGQLGIKVPNILGFTRVMSDLGVATNMGAQDAAMSLARLANITGMSQKDFDRLGSTIVHLGNNLATTESEITEFGLRIAGAGSQVGLSEAQILAFGGALSSVGINAEAGGTAISKVMIELANAVANGGKGLSAFAEVSNMSSKDFKKAFEDDAAGAIVAFVEGLGKMSDSGENVFAVLDDLELSEIRVRDALLRASGAGDLLRESLELGNTAWEENNALTKEAESRYATTESQIQIMKNRFEDVLGTIGDALVPALMSVVKTLEPLIKMVEKAAVWFGKLDPGIQGIAFAVAAVAAAIGPILLVMGLLITSVGSVMGAFAGLSGALAGAGGFLGIMTGPIGLVIAGFAGITLAVTKLYNSVKNEALPEIDRFGSKVSENTKKALDGFFQLSDGASQKLKELSLSQQVVTEDTKNQLVKKYSEMNTQILAKVDERQTGEMARLKNFFKESYALTSQEEDFLIMRQEELHKKEVRLVGDKDKAIKEILTLAAKEKRELSENEQNQINLIQKNMNENAVKYLSENEMESKIIMERMKQTAGDLSARQAAEVVKNSHKQKELAVKAANEQYDDSIAEVIRMRDETGLISEEIADKMISQSKRHRDITVKAAEETHKGVVDSAKAQSQEHADQVNWETGEIYGMWDLFRKRLSNIWESIKDKLSLDKVFAKIKAVTTVVLTEVVGFIQEKLGSIKTFWDENGSQILQAVKNVFNGIMAVIKFIMPAIKFIIDMVWTAIKQVISGTLDVIMGLIKVFSGLFTGDFGKMWEGIKQIFFGAIDAVIGWMTLTFVGGLKTLFLNLGKALLGSVKTMGTGIVNFFRSFSTTGQNLAKGFVDLVVGFFRNFVDAVITLFKLFTSRGKSTFEAFKGTAVAIFKAIGDGITLPFRIAGQIIQSIAQAIRNVVTGNFTGLRDSVTSIFGSVRSTITNIWNGVMDFFRGINLFKIGKDIISGLINGIGSMGSAVWEKAKSIASSVGESIKKKLEIKSPSRVLMGLGEFAGEGLAIGLENMLSKIQNASGEMAMAAIPNIPSMDIPSFNSSGFNSQQSNEGIFNRNTQPINIQLVTPDRRVMAEWLVDPITEMQKFNIDRDDKY